MIRPILSEEEWLAVLQNANAWIPPHKPTLVVSPHPDDETLGAGGLIAYQALRDIPVTVAAVTDGEAAYRQVDQLARIRQAEQEKAAKCLGLTDSIVRLGLPDADVSMHEFEMAATLQPLIHANTLVLAPWIHDWHPDHEACARVARKLSNESGAELILYVFWTWHKRTSDVFNGASLLRFELSPEVQSARQSALACYTSQLRQDKEEPILPSYLLAPACRTFETFISHV